MDGMRGGGGEMGEMQTPLQNSKFKDKYHT